MDYYVRMMDNDVVACGGTQIYDLGPFFTSDAGSSVTRINADDIDITGDESVVGKYLKLEDNEGGQVACCIIEAKAKWWQRS